MSTTAVSIPDHRSTPDTLNAGSRDVGRWTLLLHPDKTERKAGARGGWEQNVSGRSVCRLDSSIDPDRRFAEERFDGWEERSSLVPTSPTI